MKVNEWVIGRVTEIMTHIIKMIGDSDYDLEMIMLTACVENKGGLYLLSFIERIDRVESGIEAEDSAIENIRDYGLNQKPPLNSLEDVASNLIGEYAYELLNKSGILSKREIETEKADQIRSSEYD